MEPIQTVPRASGPVARSADRTTQVVVLTMLLFFAFGFCTVLVDTLIPKLKAQFSLSYTEVMLTQFCFFGAYFIVSLPASWLVRRLGYLQSVTVGLLVMAAGCLGFTPAAELGVYAAFLAALFTLASGVTIVQVAANPLAASVGDPKTAHSRLTLAQAFNSLATTVGPIFGAAFILKDAQAPDAARLGDAAWRLAQGRSIQQPFLMICGAVCLIALACWLCRGWVTPQAQSSAAPEAGAAASRPLWQHRQLILGALSIFLYVGAEVAIGSVLANYLMQPTVLALDAQRAGAFVSAYWGAAMVGRFGGARLLRGAAPGRLLAVCACAAVALSGVSAASTGWLSAAAIVGIGLFNSIMFPTIFALALEGLQERAAEASGLLCLAIVGGAVIPLLVGVVADATTLSTALVVPAACYVGIAVFGWGARR